MSNVTKQIDFWIRTFPAKIVNVIRCTLPVRLIGFPNVMLSRIKSVVPCSQSRNLAKRCTSSVPVTALAAGAIKTIDISRQSVSDIIVNGVSVPRHTRRRAQKRYMQGPSARPLLGKGAV